jgi:hypothetical protein
LRWRIFRRENANASADVETRRVTRRARWMRRRCCACGYCGGAAAAAADDGGGGGAATRRTIDHLVTEHEVTLLKRISDVLSNSAVVATPKIAVGVLLCFITASGTSEFDLASSSSSSSSSSPSS